MKLEISTVSLIFGLLFQVSNGLYIGEDIGEEGEKLVQQYWVQSESLLVMADFEILKLYPSEFEPNVSFIDCIDNGMAHLKNYKEEGFTQLKNCIAEGNLENTTLLMKHLHASSCEDDVVKQARSEIFQALKETTSCIANRHIMAE